MDLQQFLHMTDTELKANVNEQEKAIVEAMLHHIGNPNAYMRETVSYQLFARLLEMHFLSDEAVTSIVTNIVDNELLLQGIKTGQSDDVFLRATSAMWLILLLKVQKYSKNLPNMVYSKVQQQSTKMLSLEQDGRGFISQENGWADAVGTAAELCYACVMDERFDIKQTAFVLQSMSQAIWGSHVFVNNEDERFIKIIMGFIKKGVDEQLLIEWVEQQFDKLEFYTYERGYTNEWFMARTNLLQLMKTTYFHLKFSQQYDQLRAVISIFIQRWLKN